MVQHLLMHVYMSVFVLMRVCVLMRMLALVRMLVIVNVIVPPLYMIITCMWCIWMLPCDLMLMTVVVMRSQLMLCPFHPPASYTGPCKTRISRNRSSSDLNCSNRNRSSSNCNRSNRNRSSINRNRNRCPCSRRHMTIRKG